MGVIVVFNYPLFIARYPEFGKVDPVLAQEYFNEAQMYCRNDGGGPVTDPNVQTMFLNMLTAHVAALNAAQVNGQADPNNPGAAPAPNLVGRISSASEGSVSVSTEYANQSPSASFFLQTKYGAAFWQASVSYRTFRYVPGCSNVGLVGPFGGFGSY